MAMIDSSIQYLKGVGPAFAKKFEKLGVTTIRDLLLCYPRKYIDYTKPYTVIGAPYDVDSCVRATVLQKEPVRRIKGGRALVRVLAADDSGVLGLSWFNTPYVADKLIIGQTYYFEGRIGGTMTRRELLHPLVRTEAQVAASPFVAVYPGTEGLPAARQAACAYAALQYVDELADPLPPELLTRYRMPTKAQAVRSIHAPQSAEDLAGARRRLIFEELYMLQIGIFLLRSHGRRKTSAPMHEMDLAPFWGSLPYAPTGAQKRSAEEIVHDLCGEVPMNRLLQGDVGSGKTLVAAAAIWFAAQNIPCRAVKPARPRSGHAYACPTRRRRAHRETSPWRASRSSPRRAYQRAPCASDFPRAARPPSGTGYRCSYREKTAPED